MRYKQPTKPKSVLLAKQLFRVSHFNPAGIALTSFFTFVAFTRDLCETFFLIIFIPEDAEFYGLSDGRFVFLGQLWSRALRSKIRKK